MKNNQKFQKVIHIFLLVSQTFNVGSGNPCFKVGIDNEVLMEGHCAPHLACEIHLPPPMHKGLQS